jgi:chromosome segregation ATPase
MAKAWSPSDDYGVTDDTLPEIRQIKRFGEKIGKTILKKDSAGDSTLKNFEKWKQDSRKFLEETKNKIEELEKNIAGILKDAEDKQRKSTESMVLCGKITAEMAAIGKKIEAAKKAGDTKAEEKHRKALKARAAMLERSMESVSKSAIEAAQWYGMADSLLREHSFKARIL